MALTAVSPPCAARLCALWFLGRHSFVFLLMRFAVWTFSVCKTPLLCGFAVYKFRLFAFAGFFCAWDLCFSGSRTSIGFSSPFIVLGCMVCIFLLRAVSVVYFHATAARCCLARFAAGLPATPLLTTRSWMVSRTSPLTAYLFMVHPRIAPSRCATFCPLVFAARLCAGSVRCFTFLHSLAPGPLPPSLPPYTSYSVHGCIPTYLHTPTHPSHTPSPTPSTHTFWPAFQSGAGSASARVLRSAHALTGHGSLVYGFGSAGFRFGLPLSRAWLDRLLPAHKTRLFSAAARNALPPRTRLISARIFATRNTVTTHSPHHRTSLSLALLYPSPSVFLFRVRSSSRVMGCFGLLPRTFTVWFTRGFYTNADLAGLPALHHSTNKHLSFRHLSARFFFFSNRYGFISAPRFGSGFAISRHGCFCLCYPLSRKLTRGHNGA